MSRSFSRCRAARIAGSLLALLLSWQAAGGPLAAAWELDSAHCCCHHGERCRCPKCAHGRAIESNQCQIRTCGGGAMQLLLPEARVCLPPQSIEETPLPIAAVPDCAPPDPGIPPVRDVPTPPPLA